MKALYIDNYRGFNDTYIPIKDVNFLVGENSTGKTSILGIVQLLADYSFWMEQQFNNASVQLGTFNDIITIGSNNTTDFKIGLVYATKDDANTFAFMAKFGQREGLPWAKRFDFYRSGLAVNVLIEESFVQYRSRKQKLGESKERSLKSLLDEWKVGGKSHSGFKKLKFPKGMFPFQQALIYGLQMIEHQLWSSSKEYFTPLYYSVLNVFSDLSWLAPIRSKPKRTYDDYKTDFAPDGSHIPYRIRKMLSSSKIGSKFREFMRDFGKKSGLLDSITIRQFGKKDIISPFGLDIEIDGKQLNIKNVGYGISQALPVVVEIYEGSNRAWFAIQQPEIHLHPRAQAALGDLIYKFANREKKKFLIETHSDYTIDRFRSNYRKNRKDKTRPDAQVLFFRRTTSGNEVCPIHIDSSGEYSREQPKEFRGFFIKEELNTLGIRT